MKIKYLAKYNLYLVYGNANMSSCIFNWNNNSKIGLAGNANVPLKDTLPEIPNVLVKDTLEIPSVANVTAKDILTREELQLGRKSGTHITNAPFLGYKKVKCRRLGWIYNRNIDVVAQVEIPQDATIIRPTHCFSDSWGDSHYYVSDQLRTNHLTVLDFYDKNGNILDSSCHECWSLRDPSFEYEKRKRHTPDSFNTNIAAECTHGLHFFPDFELARNYTI